MNTPFQIQMAGGYGYFTMALVAGMSAAFGIITGYTLNHFLLRSYMKKVEEEENCICDSTIFFPTPKFGLEHPISAVSQLKGYLARAKKSLKICVMSISLKNSPLVDLLIEKHRNGVAVKIYTSKDIRKLRTEGIPIRYKKYLYKTTMHNKFIIIDDKIVITGSLNWTTMAFIHQQENLVILSNKSFVSKYCERFDKLWKLYELLPEMHL